MARCPQCFECTRCHFQSYVKCYLEEGGAVKPPEACGRPEKPCTGTKFKLVWTGSEGEALHGDCVQTGVGLDGGKHKSFAIA